MAEENVWSALRTMLTGGGILNLTLHVADVTTFGTVVDLLTSDEEGLNSSQVEKGSMAWSVTLKHNQSKGIVKVQWTKPTSPNGTLTAERDDDPVPHEEE
jgi:chitodextrinase